MKRVLFFLLIVMSFLAVQAQNPEPAGWHAGDMHVHRSCGSSPVSVSTIYQKMGAESLSAVSLLADMGNGEVQSPTTDLPLVNGQDDPVSTFGRLVHWDAEWHWDATYTQYPHQALGGHLVSLGLNDAHQIWDESTHTILLWAHGQNAVSGFAHMQYLPSGIPTSLNCCIPIEYPVEVALGAADFISEDISGNEYLIDAYYRLLNSGFRPGLAAGTDYPCNDGTTVGSPLTFVRVANGDMTYRNWVDGISSGRTVVSRNGHNEFLDLKVNNTAAPGDEIQLSGGGTVQISVQWTATQNLSGTIELVSNGTVVASKQASVGSGSPSTLTASVNFTKSGWLAARRMGANGHVVHTAAVLVMVDNQPIRANATDAQFYVQWMDNLLTRTSPGGSWNSYFPTSLSATQARYQSAKALYQQIANEAQGGAATLTSITVTPANPALSPGRTQQFVATGMYSDGSSLDLTGQVVWSSSNSSAATINLRGLAAAVNAGSTTITASLGNVSAGTSLNVQAPALSITTESLAAATTYLSYSATLAATGGTLPYTWSISSNSLPPGLTLNPSTGVISGTPTTAGTSTFTVKATDSSSPAQAATKSLSIVVVGTSSCPCSIWPSTAVPAVPDGGPDSSVELGVRFHADVDGYITFIRFYKAAGNTGTHTGNLWSASGTRLATATFTGESASGWQQVNFSSPVAVTANTAYIASYHTDVGHYAYDQNYFANTGVDNPPLHAYQDSSTTPNGPYVYGASAFPTQTWYSTNYYVDVIFVPAGPDTTPPTVASVSPSAGASGVDTQPSITATFGEPVNASTVNTSSFQLLDSSSAIVAATVSYDGSTNTATLKPTSSLLSSSTYKVIIKGGVVTDMAGNALASDYTWSFTTAAPPPPPPNEGPGGPILIVSSSSNPFSRYYAEILRAEGLNDFTAMDVSLVSASTLANYDLVILGEFSLTSSQASMFTDWVNGGGNLIAMRPDKQLAGLLGLQDAGTVLNDAYLLMNTASGPGTGLVNQTIQFHGTADRYSLNGATRLATLYSTSSTSTSNPAVVLNHAGLGQAAAFTYDLARSVVYTRQGNPAWSGQNRDGRAGPIRPNDLFYGGAADDYVDLAKVAIPQADEQQRLLANLILQMNQSKRPLPRFWYFPRGLKAAVVLTGDDHGAMYGGGATALRFDHYKSLSPAGCSVADWQCVRSTSYVVAPVIASDPLTNTQAATYQSQGFEVSVHGDSVPDCVDWTPSQLTSYYTNQIASFKNKYTSVSSPKTHRMHCVSWSDYDTQPQVELQNSIRLDTTYYYWPGDWINNVPGMFTGSGMPMRFAKRDGTMLDVYQATTQMTDESGQSYPYNINTLLDNALGTKGYYGFFTANMHNDSDYSPGADAIIDSALTRGVPVISAAQLLTWLDGRNSSSFKSLTWNGSSLTFSISIAAGANGIQAMLPANSGTGLLTTLTLNGSPVAFTTQTIKGVSYAVFSASAGTYEASYSSGSGTVTLTAVTMNPASVEGGTPSTGTVTLSGPAPSAGAEVLLSTSDPASTTLPQTPVVVPATATSATFTVNTSGVTGTTNVTISASYGGKTVTSGLTIAPVAPAPAVASLALNPTSVVGSTTSSATVTLTQPAPTGGSVVNLATADAKVASAPASLTVPEGNTSATFAITTYPVSASTAVAITATLGGDKAATLTVTPPTPTSVAVDPASATGGATSTGTVTLNAPAPTGGASVNLMSSNTAAATVPANVLVNAGATTATFTISTSAVASSTTATISASYGGSSASVSLTVTPSASLSSIALNPTTVVGSNTSTATVTLTQAAPTNGVVVTLSSANTAAASVPASVTVAAGNTTATFTVTTYPVSASTPVAIAATFGSVEKTATLTVTPPAPSSVTLNPSSLAGGNTSTATVTLNGPAPAGGASVSLTSSNATAATVPSGVTVAQGATSATFTVSTTVVATPTTVTITASCGGSSASALLTVNPAGVLSTLTLNPTTVVGTRTSTGTVTLTAAAATGGAIVNLSSANPVVATVPASVTVAAGSTTATFTVTTYPVMTQTRVVITASVGGVTRTATLTVNPPALSTLSLAPTAVTGGGSSTGTVTLSGAAPTGGILVTLASSSASAASVPTNVTVATGATTATFPITTYVVSASTTSSISARYGTVTRTATLTVRAAALSSLTLNPPTVKGGNPSIGTVTLTGTAPVAIVVSLASSGSNAIVPASVTIPAGSISASFTVQTRVVTATRTPTISASYNSVKKSARLTITP